MEQFVCLPFHAERKMCAHLSELERQEWHLPNADAGLGRIFLGSTPWFPIWEQLIPEMLGGFGVLVPEAAQKWTPPPLRCCTRSERALNKVRFKGLGIFATLGMGAVPGSQGGHPGHLSCHRIHPSDNHKYCTDHFQPVFPSIPLFLAPFFIIFYSPPRNYCHQRMFSPLCIPFTPQRERKAVI